LSCKFKNKQNVVFCTKQNKNNPPVSPYKSDRATINSIEENKMQSNSNPRLVRRRLAASSATEDTTSAMASASTTTAAAAAAATEMQMQIAFTSASASTRAAVMDASYAYANASASAGVGLTSRSSLEEFGATKDVSHMSPALACMSHLTHLTHMHMHMYFVLLK
jgi:hypothetical protein